MRFPCLLATGLCVAPALAQTLDGSDDVPTIRSGEPLDEDVAPDARLPPDIEVLQERGEVQLSLGLSYTRSARLENLRLQRSRALGLPVALSIGLAHGVEISVSTAFDYGERETLLLDGHDSSSETDVGDVSIGLSRRVRAESVRSPGIAATLDVSVPVDDGDGENGAGSVGLNVSFTRSADPLLLFWSVGYSRALGESEIDGVRTRAGDSFPYGLGFSFVVNSAVSVDTRFHAVFARDSREDGVIRKGSGGEPMYLATALSYRSGGGRTWRVGITQGLNDDGGDVELAVSRVMEF